MRSDENNRQACVQAINAYHQEHVLVPLVVCSRFDRILRTGHPGDAQCRGDGTVLEHAADRDLPRSAGPQLKGLRAAMTDDPTLQELAVTPLMLSIMSLTYSGKSLDEIRAEGTTASRKQIFEHYRSACCCCRAQLAMTPSRRPTLALVACPPNETTESDRVLHRAAAISLAFRRLRPAGL